MSLSSKKVWGGFLAPLFVLGLIFQLAGCGEKESEQSKAFTEFLQTSVINGTKIHLPTLTEEQKKSFGDYTENYALLTDFNGQVNSTFSSSMQSAMNELRSLSSMKAMIDGRDKVEKAQTEIKIAQDKLDEKIKAAEQRDTAFKQPANLKAVYAQAYAKIVTQQGDLAKQTLVLINSTVDDILKISDFLKAQGDKIEYQDHTVQFTDQATLDKFNEINASLQNNQQQLIAVAQKVAALM